MKKGKSFGHVCIVYMMCMSAGMNAGMFGFHRLLLMESN